MKNPLKSFTLITLIFIISSCNTKESKESESINTIKASTSIPEVDQYVNDIMARNGIPGAAVAVIHENNIIHKNYYGFANIEHKVPVQKHTIFPLLSTTKIPVTTAIFKLIETKKIKLEDTIGVYLNDLPDAWKSIEIKYLLAHSSGLPDVVAYQNETEENTKKKVYADDFIFHKGETFNYNQTNFWLLARIIEKVTGENFEKYLLKNQFNESPSVLFSTNMLEIVENRANRYTFFNDRKEFETDAQINGKFLNSCNGLNLSLNAFIEWSQKFNNDLLITNKTKNTMWEKFQYTNKALDFAYGWEILNTNNISSYGFSGGYTTAYRTFPEEDLTIIWLTNGFKKFYSTDPVINYIAGIVNSSLTDNTSIITEKVTKLFFEKDIVEAVEIYQKIKQDHPTIDLDDTLNTIASAFLQENKIEESLKVYNLNVEGYPNSWKGYYGRGNAYRKKGDVALAALDYRKAAELNTNDADKSQLYKMAAELEK